MDFKIRDAAKDDAIAIQKIAVRAWNHTHVPNIGQEQVDYMVSRIYSVEGLHKQMNEGEKYILISENETPVGYLSFTIKDTERYHINKLYIDPDYHGKGFGKVLLDEAIKIIKNSGGSIVELHVNEHNTKAIGFYEKYGFRNIRLDHYPFEKYMIHDYLMEMEV